jgi:hypothetical protein
LTIPQNTRKQSCTITISFYNALPILSCLRFICSMPHESSRSPVQRCHHQHLSKPRLGHSKPHSQVASSKLCTNPFKLSIPESYREQRLQLGLALLLQWFRQGRCLWASKFDAVHKHDNMLHQHKWSKFKYCWACHEESGSHRNGRLTCLG